MLKQELIKKVKKYLEEKNIIPVEGSLEYLTFKKKMIQRDGSKKDMHVIGFLSDFNKSSIDGVKGCSVYIYASTNELAYIITPYYLHDIDKNLQD